MSLPNTQRDSRLRPLTVFEQAARIDFAQLDARQEQHVKATGSLVADAVRDIQKNVVNQVQRHQIIKKGRYGQARKIKINTRKVQTLLYNSFMYIYLEGKLDAKRETEASLGKRIRFADEIALLTPIESQERFRKRVPIRKSEFAKMSARERNKAFTVAGMLEKDMIGSVQTLIDKSIDQGWTQAEFKTALEKANIKYTGTVYGTDKLKGEPITPYHMETILRTNFADVYNRGRDSFFNDPDVVEFVPAFQYSAILDSRTRDDHRKMDGRIYNRDDPIWMRWNPPNGFSCRCIRVPVTSNMDYSVSNPTTLQPDTGFGDGLEAAPPLTVAGKEITAKEVRTKFVAQEAGNVQEAKRLEDQAEDIRRQATVAFRNDNIVLRDRLTKQANELSLVAGEIKSGVTQRGRQQIYVANPAKITTKFADNIDDKLTARITQGLNEFSRFTDDRIMNPSRRAVNITKTRSNARSWASGSSIKISTLKSRNSTIHEMGHWLEDNVNQVRDSAIAFYNKRTIGEKGSQLPGFAKGERGKRDKFIDRYMGKEYKDKGELYATEIVSMGLQYFYEDPYRLAKSDPGYFDFIYNLLRGLE